jgi:uncharacterized membrane protein YqjE
MSAPSALPGQNQESGQRPRSSIVLNSLAIAAPLFTAVLIGLSQGRLRRMIEEFEVKQSVFALLALSPWLTVVLGAVSLLTLVRASIRRLDRVATTWNLMAIGFAVVGLVLYVVGVFAPLLTLIDSLS